jgi:hypothetical protein
VLLDVHYASQGYHVQQREESAEVSGMSDRHCWLHHTPIGYHLESGQLPCGGVYCLCFTLWVGARGYTALYARAVVECGLCYQTCHMSGAQGADLADQTSVGGGNAAPLRWRGRVAVHVCGSQFSTPRARVLSAWRPSHPTSRSPLAW